MRKKVLTISAALVLALVGCSSAPEKVDEKETKTEAKQEATVEEEKPEEKAAEEEATEEAAPEETTSTVEWTAVNTDDEAAQGAGIDKFDVPDAFSIGDLDYANPSFAYAGGVAQATYDTPATQFVIRKAKDTYTAPLSDRELDTFASRWHKVYEGTDVTCYGVAKGAVTVATWTDGSKSYGITYQGLGGEEMSMDSDELLSLVKAINEGNADQDAKKKAEEEKAAQEKAAQEKAEQEKAAQEKAEQEKAQAQSFISAENAEALVEKTCGGTCMSIDLVTTNQYGQCWYATAVDDEGTKYEYYVNNDGIYLISEQKAEKKPETKKEESDPDQPADEHYEGEPVTIYDSVYAEWHKSNDGQWYATFITYNGTQVFSQTAPAGGGWVFYALDGGSMVQVIYSDMESSEVGEVGPGGVSSHWQSLDGGAWY